MVVGVGGGTRVRHTISVALDLGLPTGGVAQLVGAMEEANAVFLNALLAKHGSIVMQREHFWELPLYLESGMLPIVISMPPYHFWEPPPEDGPLPTHGSDFGLFILAEVLGMKQLIFVKDEDGLYDKDPKKHADAKLIKRTTLDELLAEHARGAHPRSRSSSTPWQRRAPRRARADRQRAHARRAHARARRRGRRHRHHEGADADEQTTHERREHRERLADATLTTGAHAEGIDYRPVAMMPDVKVVKIGGQSIMDRGRAALFPILDELVARQGQAQAPALLRRRHARAPHLRDRERARDADRRPRRARRLRAAAERAHAADAARQARRPLHPARRLREAAALLPARLHPDHDRHAAVRLLGEAERGRAHPASTAPTPACSSPPRCSACKRAIFIKDEDGLYDDDPKKNPTREAHPAHRRAASCSKRDLPDLVARARRHRVPDARALLHTSCRSSTASSAGMVTRALEGEDVGTIIYKD